MDTPLVIAILAFSVILLAFLGISSYLQRRKTIAELRQRVKGKEHAPQTEETPQSSSRTKKQLVNALATFGGAIKPRNEADISRLRRTLNKAGYRGANASITYHGAKVCLAILLSVVFALLRTFAMPTLTSSPIMFLIVLSAVVGFYIPNLWVRVKLARRRRKLVEGFPDALDLMVVCVEAGLGLDAAINRVAEELKFSHGIISEEFRLVNLELRAGQERETALRNLSYRTDLEDVSSLVALLIQTDRFGTSIGQALRVQSESMRVKRRQQAEELASKLPVKLLFPLIFFIFPSLLVVILAPAVIQITKVLLPRFSGR